MRAYSIHIYLKVKMFVELFQISMTRWALADYAIVRSDKGVH